MRTISKRLALIPTCLALGWMSAALAAPKVYVADETDGAVRVIATDLRQPVLTVATDVFPHGLRLSPDGQQACEANCKGSTVSVIDPKTRAVR